MVKSDYIKIGIVLLCILILSVIWAFWLGSYFEVLIDAGKEVGGGSGGTRYSLIHSILMVAGTFLIASTIIAAVSISRKARQKKTAHKEVLEQLNLFSHVFENALEGIVVTDSDANIQSVNPAFSDITGYSAEEAIGANPRILRSDRHTLPFYKSMWKSLLTEGHGKGEIRNRRKSGEA